jgi:hypothetical protein
MNIGVDAAALGMANAVTASTSDEFGVLEPWANAFRRPSIVFDAR